MKWSLAHGARLFVTVMFLSSAASPASADWLLTPYLGVVFGGSANTVEIDDLTDSFEQRLNVGGSAAFMGGGKVGFEIDFNYAPNFFQLTQGGENFSLFDVDSSLTTLMANVIIGGTAGNVRPYFAGGAGLMRASIKATDLFDDLSTNELGVNVGGGLHIFFSDTVGLRGDVRYFRGLEQDDTEDDFGFEDFDYWRGTIGVTFRIGG
jgi:opacity protein-like surface antigen